MIFSMWKRILLILISLIAIVFLAKTLYGIVTAPPLGAHFPQRIKLPNSYLDAGIKGKLILDHGCLRVGAENGYSDLLIWDSRFTTRMEQGVVQVIDRATGEVLASVGDFVEGGGGLSTDILWLSLKQRIPKECPGPYWAVGDPLKKVDKP